MKLVSYKPNAFARYEDATGNIVSVTSNSDFPPYENGITLTVICPLYGTLFEIVVPSGTIESVVNLSD